jgi:hypothetical protein
MARPAHAAVRMASTRLGQSPHLGWLRWRGATEAPAAHGRRHGHEGTREKAPGNRGGTKTHP